MLRAEVLIFLFSIFIAFIESVKCLVRLNQHTVRFLRSKVIYNLWRRRRGEVRGGREAKRNRML